MSTLPTRTFCLACALISLSVIASTYIYHVADSYSYVCFHEEQNTGTNTGIVSFENCDTHMPHQFYVERNEIRRQENGCRVRDCYRR